MSVRAFLRACVFSSPNSGECIWRPLKVWSVYFYFENWVSSLEKNVYRGRAFELSISKCAFCTAHAVVANAARLSWLVYNIVRVSGKAKIRRKQVVQAALTVAAPSKAFHMKVSEPRKQMVRLEERFHQAGISKDSF